MPDILKEVVFLSSFSINPGPVATGKLMKVLNYVRATKDTGVRLNFLDPTLVAYCDASFGVHTNGRSHTGIYITVGDAGGPVLVKSSMQKLVSTSSTEAEMIALVAAVQRVLPLRTLLLELGIEFDCCVKIYEDNKSCIAIAEAGAGTSGQRKHFRVKYFFIKELIQERVIRIVHCPSAEMIADLCTKPATGPQFRRKRATLLNIPEK